VALSGRNELAAAICPGVIWRGQLPWPAPLSTVGDLMHLAGIARVGAAAGTSLVRIGGILGQASVKPAVSGLASARLSIEGEVELTS
jgi:hypothetical protein